MNNQKNAKLIIFSLVGCGFSIQAKESLKKFSKDNIIIKEVTSDKKSIIKYQNEMNTFPQIFIEFNDNKYPIGGNSDLQNILRLINKVKSDCKGFDEMISLIMQNYNLDKRIVLELINILK